MIPTKKLVNSVETCVNESIEGFVALHPGVRQLTGQPRVVVRADIEAFKRQGKVLTVTGGGSGHEPCFLGYVGHGMMSATVHGSLFASPAPATILTALRALGLNHPAGVIVLINNYTGDRLNFGIAIERARVEGLRVDIVINAEDCALSASDKGAGRRGLAAMVFIMKIVGHLSEAGEPLESIMKKAESVIKQVGTMGVCLSPCSLPGTGPMFQLGPRDMELGMGLHGEAGVRRVEMGNASDVVRQVLGHMTSRDNVSRIALNKDDHVALLLNNLGSTSDLELNIVALEAFKLLEHEYGVHVDRAYAGKFVASMEMAGFSLTLMLLDSERRQCLDSPCSAVGWLKPYLPQGSTVRTTPSTLTVAGCELSSVETASLPGARLTGAGAAVFKAALVRACQDLITNMDLLNELDSEVGDGDCGSTLANGARMVLNMLENNLLHCDIPHQCLLAIADTVEQSMGGCSGAMYSLLFTAASKELSVQSEITSQSWMHALNRGIEAISCYGRAEPGDRTMLDPLHAAWLSASQQSSSNLCVTWRAAVNAAAEAAEQTSEMMAGAGRASYVSSQLLKRPDAGAKACAIWLSAVFSVYAESIHA